MEYLWLVFCLLLFCLATSLMTFDELARYMVDLSEAAYDNGRKDGFAEGKAFVLDKKNTIIPLNCTKQTVLSASVRSQEFDQVEFGILKAIEKMFRKGVTVDVLRIVLEEERTGVGAAAGGGAGDMHKMQHINYIK
ncbi:hypothetical protein Hanom_Chr07g00618881 [Helianthus anomalus]